MKKYSFYILFFVLALSVHLFLPLEWADDAVFYEKATSMGLADFLKNSSRLLTDSLTYFFALNQILWRIVNPIILTAFLWIIQYLLPFGESKKSRIIACFAVFPLMVLVDAGFIATTLNYLWTITFGLFCLVPMKDCFNGKETALWIKILLLPMLIYSCNMQQMCVVLLGCFIFGNLYFIIKRKKLKVYLLIQFLCAALLSVYSYAVNVFSDNSRMFREINRYFPEFEQLNVFEKLELGFFSTFYCMIVETRLAWIGFFAFCVFLAVCVCRTENKLHIKFSSLFPCLFSLACGSLYLLESPMFNTMKNYGVSKAVYSFEPCMDIVFVLVLSAVLVSVLSVVKANEKKLLSVFILALGFGSRMLMGFSPTVWASGYRTFSILFVCFIMVAIIIINDLRKAKHGVI